MHEQTPTSSSKALYRQPAGERLPSPGPGGGVKPLAAGAAAPRCPAVASQWTPKDDLAALKLHGRCDDVMRLLMEELGLQIPSYER